MGRSDVVRNVVEFQVEKLSLTQMDMTKVTVRCPALSAGRWMLPTSASTCDPPVVSLPKICLSTFTDV